MKIDEQQDLKSQVAHHWEAESCGVRYGVSPSRLAYYNEIEQERYRLEPYIQTFARFPEGKGKKVLEIGVGAGTDFHNWLRNGAVATGVDLTEAGIATTRERLDLNGVDPSSYRLRQADAETLPFDEGEFDLVYSWGVLHHTPDTEQAFAEAFRVLKPGGKLRAMIYHVPSWVGLMLWVQHCFLKGKPFQSLKYAVFHHLESPGTKAYSLKEAKEMATRVGYKNVAVSSLLGPGDRLTIKPSSKYQSPAFRLIWRFYPRWLVALLGDRYGLNLLIEAEK